MKRLSLLIAAMLLALPLLGPRAALAWPGPVEAFLQALEAQDGRTAASAFTADATLTIPLELLAPDSALAPPGARQAGTRLTLTGRAQIAAWLEEFAGRYKGRLTMNGPAQIKGEVIAAYASLTASYLPDAYSGWISGTGEFTLVKGTQLSAFALVLSPKELQRLRQAHPQSYAPDTPAFRGRASCGRAL